MINDDFYNFNRTGSMVGIISTNIDITSTKRHFEGKKRHSQEPVNRLQSFMDLIPKSEILSFIISVKHRYEISTLPKGCVIVTPNN